jgi:predicted nuclease of predicted toxin-antitoxin system
MKAKLDENLPLQVASILQRLGHDIHTMPEEGLAGCADADLWRATQREGRTLITQDMDFSDSRRFVLHGIVLIRLRSPSRLTLVERVEEIFRNEAVSTWTGCFVVVTEQKVRVRKPPT